MYTPSSASQGRVSTALVWLALLLPLLSCVLLTGCNVCIAGGSNACSQSGGSSPTSSSQSPISGNTSPFPTDPASAAKYLGITTDDASFRSIPDGAGPDTLIGWQISANHDITVSIGPRTCIDFVKDPNNTHVTSGTYTDLSSTRIRSTSQVQIFLPSGYQLSFYKTPC